MIGFYADVAIVGSIVEKYGEKYGETSTQKLILQMMFENPKVSAKSISETIGLSLSGVEKSIKSLKDAGLIERIGSAKGGHWVVNGVDTESDFLHKWF
jgi:ATP-dependent DNA helicase RecG